MVVTTVILVTMSIGLLQLLYYRIRIMISVIAVAAAHKPSIHVIGAVRVETLSRKPRISAATPSPGKGLE